MQGIANTSSSPKKSNDCSSGQHQLNLLNNPFIVGVQRQRLSSLKFKYTYFVLSDDSAMLQNIRDKHDASGDDIIVRCFGWHDEMQLTVPPQVQQNIDACLKRLRFEDPIVRVPLMTVIEQHLEGLFAIPGVVGVTGGYKTRRGFTDYTTPCIKVVVKSKTLNPFHGHLIPQELGGFPVDVTERQMEQRTMFHRLFSSLLGPQATAQPPLRVGDMIVSLVNGVYVVGTLGAFAHHESGVVALSAGHVIDDTGTTVKNCHNEALGTTATSFREGVIGRDYGAFTLEKRHIPLVNWNQLADDKTWEGIHSSPIQLCGPRQHVREDDTRLHPESMVEGTSAIWKSYRLYDVFMWPELHFPDCDASPVVFKMGCVTGLTRGEASKMLFFTSLTQVRYVIPSAKPRLFSQNGDCGAIVVDAGGHPIGMITAGSASNGEFADWTLVTPITEITTNLGVELGNGECPLGY
jgi:hypothetical protein